MPLLFTLILLVMGIKTALVIEYDFGKQGDTENWNIINDGVMGGLSKGHITTTDSTIMFYGTISLQNDGGFTSYKSPFGSYDLSEIQTISIRYRSTGQGIGLTLENDRS